MSHRIGTPLGENPGKLKRHDTRYSRNGSWYHASFLFPAKKENSGMSQFYMRFIRYTSTEYKDIYFLNYTGSLEIRWGQQKIA